MRLSTTHDAEAEGRADAPTALSGPTHEHPDSFESVDQFLTMLARMIRLPERDRQSIRDELESHLNERVRDLMIDGRTEPQAVREATEELGTIADLADRFRAAHRIPRRRRAMNIGLIGLTAVTAVGVGTMNFTPENSPANPSIFEQAQDERVTQYQERLTDLGISVDFNDTPVSEVLAYAAELSDVNILVHDSVLADHGYELDEILLDFRANNISTAELLNIVERRIHMEYGGQDPEVVWSYHPDYIELAMREHVQRASIKSVTYEIGAVITRLEHVYDFEYGHAVDTINQLIIEMVAPDNWVDNGGNLASLWIVGGKLFVEAPITMHEKIHWIVNELHEEIPARSGLYGGGAAGTTSPAPGGGRGGVGGMSGGGGLDPTAPGDGGHAGRRPGSGGGGAGGLGGAGGSGGGSR